MCAISGDESTESPGNPSLSTQNEASDPAIHSCACGDPAVKVDRSYFVYIPAVGCVGYDEALVARC